MNTVRRAAFDLEIAHAKELILSGDLQQSFSHLERAHV
jgi:hypothetical protein